jgi:hypothetical protein
MSIVRSCLLAAAVALTGTMAVHAPAAAQTPAATSSSDVSKPRVTTKIKTWTRARLDAAKKRWAADNAKFAACSKQLAEQQETKKVSLHQQGHFMQDCMNRKP